MSNINYSWDFSKEDFDLDLDFFNEKDQEDKLWQARTGLNKETICGAIESIVFMSDRPINLQKIKSYIDTDLPLRVVHESICKLQEEYELKHHGIRLMEVAEGYHFRTKASYSNIIQKIFKVNAVQLSPTALEVLAIIAYKQPVSKNDIEKTRGVDSSHIVRALMDKRLVKTAGKSDEVGRPSLYATTQEFLEVFNLNSLEDLPSEIELEELADSNSVGDIKSIVQLEKRKAFDYDEIEELDKLSSTINQISSDTLFTKSLSALEKNRKSETGQVKRSAFDILEDYMSRSQVIEQNKEAAMSQPPMNMISPAPVEVSSLTELINAPSEDTFSGELEVGEIEAFQEKLDGVLAKSDQILNDRLEQEEVLEDELDKAFEQLMSSPTDSSENLDIDQQ